MARPAHDELTRLKHKLWVRALRIAWAEANPQISSTWGELEKLLLKECGVDPSDQGRAQGIYGVVNKGADPRKLIRRIRIDELKTGLPEGAKVVSRNISGHPGSDEGDDRQADYWELNIDLVDAGEKLCPGSSSWMTASIWGLSYRILPDLWRIRINITLLMEVLRVATLSPCELRQRPPGDGLDVEQIPHEELATRYRRSLELINKNVSANNISLLACLVAESYILEQEDLLEMHVESFSSVVKDLLSNPLMDDISHDFMRLVWSTIVTQDWEAVMYTHKSSISRPFVRE